MLAPADRTETSGQTGAAVYAVVPIMLAAFWFELRGALMIAVAASQRDHNWRCVGHGVDAARRAAYVRAALATFAKFSSDPVQLLQFANAALVERSGTVPNS